MRGKQAASKYTSLKGKKTSKTLQESGFSPITENCDEDNINSSMSVEIPTDDDDDIDVPSTQPVDNRVLKNVIAYVEVRSTNDNRSKAICKELVQLGAVVAKKFSDDVTHVVFKEGCKRTVNKAKKKDIHLVSVLWVDSCKQNQEHVSERLYPAMLPDEKGTPLLLAKLKKAKSMQPQDFEDDVARSAERCTKKKKKLDTDRLASGNNTPVSSPLIGGILVQDTQPRTPTASMYTPIRLAIPDTPPSMRAKMKELERLKNIESEDNLEQEQPTSPKVTDPEEPIQRKLFDFASTKDNSCISLTPSSAQASGSVSLDVDNHSSASSPSTSLSEKKSKTKGRRKSVASVKFSDNIDEPIKMPRKSSRRKSVASVITTNFLNVSNCDETDGKHVPEKIQTEKATKPGGALDSTISEISVTNSKNDSSKGKKVSRGKRKSVGFSLEGEDKKGKDQSSDTQHPLTVDIDRCITSNQSNNNCVKTIIGVNTTGSDESSSKICDQSKEVRDKTDASLQVKEHAHSSTEKVKSSKGVTKSNQIEVTSKKKNISRKKLLTSSDCEPHSFLIEPSKCSQKERPKILENTNSVNRKSNRGNKRKKELDEPPAAEDDDGMRKKRVCLVGDNYSDASISGVPTGIDDTQSETAISLASNSMQSESEVNSSMSAVFSESSYPSFFGKPPPRQSICEFNLRTRFNKRKGSKNRDRRVLSDSTERKLNSDSENKSSSSDMESVGSVSESRHRKRSGSTSPYSTSPQRPSLVMTSLHSHEQDVVISVVKKLKGFAITDNVCDSTSHVICGGPRRTLNILHGITQGCWILKKEWVLESLEAGCWLPEENFEVAEFFPACKITREERESAKENFCLNLFSDVGLIYVSSKTTPSRNHLVSLLKKCEGKVTTSKSKAQLYVGHDYLPHTVSVNPLWILDCITQYRTLDTEKYLLGKPKRESSPEY